MYNITTAILTSWDLARLERAILSVIRQSAPCNLWVEINTPCKQYHREAKALCKDYRVKYHVSQQSGTAGIGKQAVFDRFQKMPGQYLLLLDGDDWLYYCAIEALVQTIEKKPFDVLTHTLIDRITYEPVPGFLYPIQLPDYALASLWGPYYNPIPEHTGRAAWLWDFPEVNGQGMTNIFSRQATQALTWHKKIGCYEDVLIQMQALSLHQADQLTSVLSCGQNIFVHDRTTPNSGQSRTDFLKASNTLRAETKKLVPEERSSLAELPTVYPPHLISYEQKVEFVQRSYSVAHRPYNEFEPMTTPEGIRL